MNGCIGDGRTIRQVRMCGRSRDAGQLRRTRSVVGALRGGSKGLTLILAEHLAGAQALRPPFARRREVCLVQDSNLIATQSHWLLNVMLILLSSTSDQRN